MTEADVSSPDASSLPDAESMDAPQTDVPEPPPPPEASPEPTPEADVPDVGPCDNALCPVGFVCDPSLGCTTGAYADSDSTLYTANLPSGTVGTVGPTAITLFDIALETDGTLYGVGSTGALYTIDRATASTKLVFMLGGPLNALDAAPDGTLYAAGGSTVYTINPSTGAQTFFLAYPAGYTSSGDLAIMPGGVMLATVMGPGAASDFLLSIDLATRRVTVIGATGFGSIWGLAARGSSLFGFTASGQILSLDTTTGKGTLLATSGASFYGASTR
jgi:hypothetical protein